MIATLVDTATPPCGPRLRSMVGLMLLSLAVMLAAIVTLCFAPLGVAPLIATSLYAALWMHERRLGVASPVTRVMTGFHLVLAWVVHRDSELSWIAWFSPMVYWTLAALILALLATGRPFTAVYAGDASDPALHRAVSLTWGALHLAAGLAALVLVPGPGFLYVPFGLMVLGALATVWMNFVSMGPASGRRPRFEIGGLSFREAVSDEDRATFHDVIAEAYRADLQSALGMRRKIDDAAIVRQHRITGRNWENDSLPFLVLAGDRPVGGICIFFDHARRGLPIEGEARIDLTPWRRVGRVAEVGRLGVVRRYRFSPAILKGLFKCVVEAAAERRIDFIFNDSFEFQAAMYKRIGFTALHDGPYVSRVEHSTGYGLEVRPMMMDLAGMVRTGGDSGIASELRGTLAPYVMERFFKQLAVREMAGRFFASGHDPRDAHDARAGA